MSSIPVRVLEFWEKVNVLTCPTWERVPTLELEFPDN